MITDTFDNKSEEIIKVCRSDSAIKVDACILTFSHVILKYVLETFQCKKIGDLYSSNGANLFMYLSTKIGVLLYICLVLGHLLVWQIWKILCQLLTRISTLFLAVRDA